MVAGSDSNTSRTTSSIEITKITRPAPASFELLSFVRDLISGISIFFFRSVPSARPKCSLVSRKCGRVNYLETGLLVTWMRVVFSSVDGHLDVRVGDRSRQPAKTTYAGIIRFVRISQKRAWQIWKRQGSTIAVTETTFSDNLGRHRFSYVPFPRGRCTITFWDTWDCRVSSRQSWTLIVRSLVWSDPAARRWLTRSARPCPLLHRRHRPRGMSMTILLHQHISWNVNYSACNLNYSRFRIT